MRFTPRTGAASAAASAFASERGLVGARCAPAPHHPQGDAAIIEYADESVATTHLTIGAEKLASMSDEQLLDYWNEMIAEREFHRQ